MGQFEIADDDAFATMVSEAQEIVLPGAGMRVPEQRTDGAYVDVTNDCVVLTDGMAAYGC